jgi:hypothetical protein
VIVNDGARKGFVGDSYGIMNKIPGLEGIWQLHRSLLSDAPHNTSDQTTANLEEGETCATSFNCSRGTRLCRLALAPTMVPSTARFSPSANLPPNTVARFPRTPPETHQTAENVRADLWKTSNGLEFPAQNPAV